METTRRVNGWDFEFVSEDGGSDEFNQCRGEVMYDDDHDEQPEPSLWQACCDLARDLEKEGYNVDVNHSEKGWVEVTILNNNN